MEVRVRVIKVTEDFEATEKYIAEKGVQKPEQNSDC
jgi:hypothetical protein